MALETKTPPQPIYRIGRQPDAWRPPDWSRASADGTFGNRFDDPESYYRVLYASSQEVSCFIETLARYRPDLTLLAELEAIEGDNDFFPQPGPGHGVRGRRICRHLRWRVDHALAQQTCIRMPPFGDCGSGCQRVAEWLVSSHHASGFASCV